MSVISEFLGILFKFVTPRLRKNAFDKFLERSKEDINQSDVNGVTLLMQVAEHKYVYGFKECLKAGADPNAYTTEGYSVLSHVLMDCTMVDDRECIEVKRKMLEILKEDDHFDINFSELPDDDRFSCLQQVEEYDDLLNEFFPKRITYANLVLKKYIAEKYKAATFKYMSNWDKSPVLNVAINAKDEESAEALLDGGDNPNKVDEEGRNALHRAAWKGCRLPLFKKILEKIENVNAGDKYGNTALMNAAQNNHLNMVVSLMKAKQIDVNAQNIGGRTALHKAVRSNHPAIVAQLLSDDRVNTSLRATTVRSPLVGETPLELAIKYKRFDIVSLFAKRKTTRKRLKLKF